jgi:hypothetical protein
MNMSRGRYVTLFFKTESRSAQVALRGLQPALARCGTAYISHNKDSHVSVLVCEWMDAHTTQDDLHADKLIELYVLGGV